MRRGKTMVTQTRKRMKMRKRSTEAKSPTTKMESFLVNLLLRARKETLLILRTLSGKRIRTCRL